jgi:dienelactone hydrolase
MTRAVLVALLLTGCATAIQGPPVDTLVDGRTGTIAFRTMTLTAGQALRGERGDNAVITGELALPPGTPAPGPAVVLMHGAGGVQDYHYQWARELRSIGFARFIVDSFSGRGIGRIVENLEAINAGSRVLDTYRALELLATHPRIDRQRVVLMGFSHGGVTTLYASVVRFQQSYLSPGLDFAAYLPFYAYCNSQLIDDDKVSRRPIRLFHGAADDYTPIAPCRAWVARIKAAGADADLKEYPFAHHGFDNPRLPPALRNHNAVNPSRCFFVERTRGEVVNAETGRPLSYQDDCWGRGATVGYDPQAYTDALATVKAFLTTTVAAGR